MSKTDSVSAIAQAVVDGLVAAGKTLATAESCTGGWIAKVLTDIAGSSQCFGYGIVSYSNGAKESLLGVDPATILEHGAVSEQVVSEMAAGVLALSGADYAVAVSGIAGPDGGTAEKPVGTVWFGWASRGEGEIARQTQVHQLDGDREAIRVQTVILALQGIDERLKRG
ncbi:MAG: CinA family protein [Woeseiaceae bacterium]